MLMSLVVLGAMDGDSSLRNHGSRPSALENLLFESLFMMSRRCSCFTYLTLQDTVSSIACCNWCSVSFSSTLDCGLLPTNILAN